MKALLRGLIYRGLLALAKRLPLGGERRSYRQVLIKLDRLGDAVLALGALRCLVEDEESTLMLVSPLAAPLIRREFPEVEVLVLPAFCLTFWPDFVRFIFDYAPVLRRLQAGRVVCLRHQASDYTRAVLHLIQTEQRYFIDWQKPWEPQALSTPDQTGPGVAYPDQADTCLELEAHRRMVAAVMGRAVSPGEVLPSLKSTPTRAGDGLLVCPVTGDAIRHYPPALLAAALQRFRRQCDWPIHVCLPPDAEAEPWKAALRQSKLEVAQWHEPVNESALIDLIAQAGVVLAPDSAPAHLAIALGKPGVFLLGGGHFSMFAPWQKCPTQRWLVHELSCFGCRWNCQHPEPYCLTQIEPQRVAETLWQVIEASKGQSRHCQK
jgi:ADP-heptose:LPS heptosyltransferase